MSRKRTDIPTDELAAYSYIKKLVALPFVKAVYIKGSRSFLTAKLPHKYSDWDIEIIVDRKLYISCPRKSKILHADVHQRTAPSITSTDYRELFADIISAEKRIKK